MMQQPCEGDMENSTLGQASPPVPQQCASHWRDKGYPGFAKWMASSDDFLVLRRFAQLNTRVVLLMQDRITRKEEELAQIESHARQHSDERGDCSSLRHEPLPQREKLLDELKPMLKEYNEYLVTFAQIKNWRSAQDYQITNVENWFCNHENAIDPNEQEFVRQGRDVIALVHKIKSPLRLLLERCQPLVLIRLFKTKTRPDQVESSTTNYYSNARFEAFVTFVIIFAGLLLLFGPMWWLQFVSHPVTRLAIITVFVLLFTSLLASATVAKPFEVLASTAAYSAVLMVFLQLGGGSGNT